VVVRGSCALVDWSLILVKRNIAENTLIVTTYDQMGCRL